MAQIETVPPALVSSLGSEDELEEEAAWLEDMTRTWLDEEWAAAELVHVHAALGAAAGQVRQS